MLPGDPFCTAKHLLKVQVIEKGVVTPVVLPYAHLCMLVIKSASSSMPLLTHQFAL